MGEEGFVFFVWLFLYGSITLASEYFAPLNAWIAPAGQLFNTLILIIWLRIRRQEKLLTFRFHAGLQWERVLSGLAYLLPSVCQLMYFGIQARSALSVLCILLAVVQEEILFRGILLKWLSSFGRTNSIVLSGIIFAAAHLLYQAVYALTAGIAFAGLAVSCESLLPCIGVHALNNLTVSDSAEMTAGYLPWFWLCAVLYLACGIGRICYLNKQRGGRKYQ